MMRRQKPARNGARPSRHDILPSNRARVAQLRARSWARADRREQLRNPEQEP